jgi:hypothetical protein
MKISRRDFLKGTATSLFLAGFNLPALATSSRKEELSSNYVTRRNGWALCSSSYWR